VTDLLRWTVGDVTITRVEETITPLAASVLIPGVTDEVLDQHPWVKHYFTDDGELRLSIHAFVVQSGAATIVVDTCVGTAKKRPLPTDPAFIDRLAAEVDGGLAGVDVVLCTHLHMDHCGWNTMEVGGELVPTFPTARYLITKAELDSLSDDRHGASVREASVDPIAEAGLLDAIEPDHRITPEVVLIPTPGHTPGHVSVLITSGADTALITGDAFHSPVQIARPDLAAEPFDADSVQSTATRRELLAAYADSDTLVLGTHFAPPTAGHIVSDGDTHRLAT